jgi:DNA-binding transcriptional LysR family regulator
VTLRQLRYLVAVAESGSFTRAAAQVGVAQPSLSQQIRALETELGGALVERLPHGARLTPAGSAVLPGARAALRAADGARDAARRAFDAEAPTIDLATVRSLAMTVVPHSIERWHRRHPGFRMRLEEFSDALALEQAVAARGGLLGIGPKPARWAGPVRSLGWDGLVALLAIDDPVVPAGEPVRLEALAERPWVLYHRTHGLRALVDEACARHGFTPLAAAETGQIETAIRLAAGGLGPTLVPAHTVPKELTSAIRPLRPAIVWEVVAFARAGWSDAADQYLDTLATMPFLRRPPDELLRLEPSQHPPAACP